MSKDKISVRQLQPGLYIELPLKWNEHPFLFGRFKIKDAAEIKLIETYMPKAASEDQVIAGVKAVIAEMGAPTMKEMGAVMKNVMARFTGAGIRVDGKQVSDAVKRELTGK